MIKDVECSYCYGHGKVHTRNGDPLDDGVDCPICEGVGAVEVDLNEECDDDD